MTSAYNRAQDDAGLTDSQHESNLVNDEPSSDGVDRRHILSCMAWAGTGMLWTLSGGVPRSSLLGAESL
ncbi:MAG TPA: hypothetical protein VLI40_02620, partial [Gemmatimonadaceae bacterium]|nr:hypothetical protein [Gemmatimonadaceae bacterium]